MQSYCDEGLFNLYKNCFIYVERTLGGGRVRKGIEYVYCRYDLNLRTGEFEDNPSYLIYQNCIFRRATPDEQKKLEEAIRRAPYQRTK